MSARGDICYTFVMNSEIQIIKKWLNTGSINIFGLPFSGKDTQGKVLAEMLEAELIGGGMILRGDNMPSVVTELMQTGQLFPTDIYFSLVLPYLSKDEFKEKPLVLNSIGRRYGEEDAVIQAANDSNHPIKAVIYLKLDEAIAAERLKISKNINDRGDRLDDRENLLDVRLSEFKEKTLPVIESYRELGVLIEIDGTKSKEEITRSIVDELFKLASRA